MVVSLEIPRFNPTALAGVRLERGLTQKALARLLRMHENVIHRWERGKTPISAADIRTVARLLRVTPAQLQYPLPPDPTLADLRTRLALTVPVAAGRLAVRERRLELWESGVLGTRKERGALLAAIVGVGFYQITAYEQTGELPVSLAHRLGKVLWVEAPVVQAAFTASRSAHPVALAAS